MHRKVNAKHRRTMASISNFRDEIANLNGPDFGPLAWQLEEPFGSPTLDKQPTPTNRAQPALGKKKLEKRKSTDG